MLKSSEVGCLGLKHAESGKNQLAIHHKINMMRIFSNLRSFYAIIVFSCCCYMKTLYNSFHGMQQVVLVQEKGMHKPPKTQLFMGKHKQPNRTLDRV